MSFNKNNPNAMGKIMGYLKQLSTDKGGSDQQRRGQTDEERLYQSRGAKYARVPSKATLSASTTCTSLATSCGSSATLAPNYATIPERGQSTESSSEDEQETFENTRLHFQQLRQISLGNEYKYKMEMEIKSAKDENIRNHVPYLDQLNTDSVKTKTDYSINADRSPYGPTTQRLYLVTQVLSAVAISMGSLIIGFSSGYTSPALPSIRNETNISISESQEKWIGGLMPLAAMVGGIIGGPLIDNVGRRGTITGISVPFLVGWLLIACATSAPYIFAGRALCGICIGIGSLAFPVYLAETVQREVRGVLGLLPTAFGNIGILLSNVVGLCFNWWQLAFFGASLSVPFFLLMLIIKESPNWYLSRDRPEDARKSLQWLRGKHANIDREIRDIALSKAESERVGSAGLFQKKYIRSVAITLGLMFFQQMSGINAVIFYTKDIFAMSGSTAISETTSAIIVGVVNFVSTFIATAAIDRLGRKVLLYISSVCIILTLSSLGAFFYLKDVENYDLSDYGWIPLTSMIIYVLGFSLGFGPIPWLMMGEILPASIRGSAAALATAFNWTCTFIVTLTFKDMSNAMGSYGTYWYFAVLILIGLFFTIVFVPETRGRSLEEIEATLTGKRPARRLSSIANLKPLPNGC